MTQPSEDLRREFGEIDIYLFDQLHRGRITSGMTVLDAGCGHGRNLVYLMRRGFDISATDSRDRGSSPARCAARAVAVTRSVPRRGGGGDVVRRCLVRRRDQLVDEEFVMAATQGLGGRAR
jgi:hypothetical protein